MLGRASATEPSALMKVSGAGHRGRALSQVGSRTGAPAARIRDVAEALTGVPDCEVLNRLRPVSTEYFLEFAHQCRPLFELGRVMRPHRPS